MRGSWELRGRCGLCVWEALTRRVAHEAFAGKGGRAQVGKGSKWYRRTNAYNQWSQSSRRRIATYDMGYNAVGDPGAERPKWVVARVVTVSFRRKLMERID